MCGIYGIVDLGQDREMNAAWGQRMGAVIRHRGPDDEGLYVGTGVILGMRRLSIIDVAGGHQPLQSTDGQIQVVCNGEIYNFRELRSNLQKKGYKFATGSDCEVLVHLYAEVGLDVVHHLDGMFAFALWDARHRRLVLGRDRLGIKPLYYLHENHRLLFASEIKALLEVPGVHAELDLAALDQLLYLGYVAAPATLFRGIRKLMPGSVLVAENGKLAITRYWRYQAVPQMSISEQEASEELRRILRQSVADQLVADVPLGAFLSGGLDSSAIVAMMAQMGAGRPKTYSIGFDLGAAGAYYNELPDARRVAKFFDTEHHDIIVRPDVAALIPRLIWHMDEPIADSALITTYLVAEFARGSVTVILSGVGGDELFGGYRRYLGPHYLQLLARIPSVIRKRCLPPLARLLPSDRHGPVTNMLRYAREFISHATLPPVQQYVAYVQLFDPAARSRLLRQTVAALNDPLLEALRRAPPDDFVNGLMQADLETQLPDDLLLLTDKMTMAASVECRVPLLSNAMMDLAARLPSNLKIQGGRLKQLFRVAVQDLLPAETLAKSKRGFGAPMGAWLRKELRPLIDATLSREAVTRRGLLDPGVVSEAIALHHTSRRDFTDHLQCLLNVEIWCRIFLDGRSPEDVATELQERSRETTAA